MKIRFDKQPSAPEVQGGLKVPYAPGKRPRKRLGWYLLVLALLVLPGYFAFRGLYYLLAVNAPAYVEMQQAELTAPVATRVVSILPNDSKVRPGETVAILQPIDLSPSKHIAPSLLAAHQALRLTEQALAVRHRELTRIRQLYDEGAATAADLANAQARVLEARSAVNSAQANLSKLRTTTTGISDIRLTAPFAGTVLQYGIQPGLWAASGSTLVTIIDNRHLWISAYLNPKNAGFAHIGKTATLVFKDGRRISAKITAIGPVAIKIPSNRISPLTQRFDAIVVKLEPLEPLPKRYRIQTLPLTVHFGFAWF